METTRVSTKGQIVLPKSVRDSRSWGPGTELVVEETRDGVLLRASRRLPATTIEEVVGYLRSGLKPRRKPVTIAQMNEAIAREVKRRHDSGRY